MNNKQYKVGAALSYASIFIGNIVGIIYTPIMLRMLGQEEYGLYALVGSLIATLSLVDLGFGNACIRYVSKYRALGDKEKEYNLNGMFLLINIFICSLALLIGYISFYFLDNFFSHSLSTNELEKFKIMFLILVFNLGISFPFSIFGSIIVSYEQFVFPKLIGIIRILLNPIVILAVLFAGYDSLAMVLANTVINILFLWVNVFYCFRRLKIKLYFKKFDMKLLKEIFIYSMFIFIAIIVDKIYWSTDQFILGMYSGTIMVSIYAIASQINMYYMQFSTAISGMFLPRLTAMITKETNIKELSQLFIKIGRIQYIVIGLVLVGLISFGKEFIIIWAGQEYAHAYYISLILVLPFTIPLIQNTGLTILQAKNLHGFRSIVLLIIALGNLAISIPLARNFGGVGCAIGTAIAMLVGNVIIMNIYYYRKIKIDIFKFWKEIFNLSFPLTMCLLIGYFLNEIFLGYGFFSLLLKIVFLTICYSVLMYLMGMNNYEKELVKIPILKIMNNFKKCYIALNVNERKSKG
ncbi:lipopolysaccharide biosynthesis protein [Sediminibacillus massiliensis]|uniref:lipopolysaccharide biosynthesis protein n=1 Tax=Sediminibacillus massiliensis TaxID=1926277 RepID=UPI0009886362|nr:oligosaccharide flippase family protein [Sediminibacillus massiliensis]